MQSPVLPLPVMPTQTPCVTRSREEYLRGLESGTVLPM